MLPSGLHRRAGSCGPTAAASKQLRNNYRCFNYSFVSYCLLLLLLAVIVPGPAPVVVAQSSTSSTAFLVDGTKEDNHDGEILKEDAPILPAADGIGDVEGTTENIPDTEDTFGRAEGESYSSGDESQHVRSAGSSSEATGVPQVLSSDSTISGSRPVTDNYKSAEILQKTIEDIAVQDQGGTRDSTEPITQLEQPEGHEQSAENTSEVETNIPKSNEKTSMNESEASSNQRIWGTTTTTTAAPNAGGTSAKNSQKTRSEKVHLEAHINRTEHTTSNVHQPSHHHHLPFVKKRGPPEGFKLSARVYIDPIDRLSHIDHDSPLIPYFDCGAAGLSTTQMDLSRAQIRFSLTQTSYKGRYPVVLIALHDLTLETTSGDEMYVQAGQMILLEDMINPGHTLRALPDQDYLLVLSLVLPHSHPQIGKEHVSLPTSRMVAAAAKGEPCPVVDENGGNGSSGTALMWTDSAHLSRQVLFGALGLSLSTLAADFLGKTAPLWLAVGVGGTCFVVGSTTLFVVGMSRLADWAEVALQKRRIIGK